MGLIGFLLLIIGGGLLLYSGTSIAIDPALATLLANFINSILGPPIGDQIVAGLVLVTSLGGVFVLVGAVIWYAAGSGIFATIGRIIVTIATFSAFYYVAMQIYSAYIGGVFSQPLDVILAYFLGLGFGFASVLMILIGNFLGAGRKKKKPVSYEDTQAA